MTSPEQAFDPLFWPLVIFAVAFAASLMAIVAVVTVMARRSAGHHPQVAGLQGSNAYDASTTSIPTLINNGEINIGTPRLRRSRELGP